MFLSISISVYLNSAPPTRQNSCFRSYSLHGVSVGACSAASALHRRGRELILTHRELTAVALALVGGARPRWMHELVVPLASLLLVKVPWNGHISAVLPSRVFPNDAQLADSRSAGRNRWDLELEVLGLLRSTRGSTEELICGECLKCGKAAIDAEGSLSIHEF